MKDRRGHGNQAYLSQTEDADMTLLEGSYTPIVEDDGSYGAASTPIASTTGNTPESPSESVDTWASTSPSAPSVAASAAEMTPDTASQDQGGSSSDGSQPGPNQGAGAGDAAASPIAEASMSTATIGGSAAPASAPMSSGGEAPSNSYAGDDMGWDAMAFAEAGGYDAVLMGSLPPGMCAGGGDGQDIFVFIDELNVDIINNTLIQETEINLIADDGSVIDIGGDFTAIQTQESLVQDGPILDASSPIEAAFIPQESSFIEADAGMA